MRQKIEIKFLGDDVFEINNPFSGVKFYADQKKEKYSPCGPNPLELFLSSLGACIGTFAKKYLQRHQIEFKELRVDIEAEFCKESPVRLADITAKVRTDAELGSNKNVFLRFIKNCPVHNTVVNTDKIDIIVE